MLTDALIVGVVGAECGLRCVCMPEVCVTVSGCPKSAHRVGHVLCIACGLCAYVLPRQRSQTLPTSAPKADVAPMPGDAAQVAQVGVDGGPPKSRPSSGTSCPASDSSGSSSAKGTVAPAPSQPANQITVRESRPSRLPGPEAIQLDVGGAGVSSEGDTGHGEQPEVDRSVHPSSSSSRGSSAGQGSGRGKGLSSAHRAPPLDVSADRGASTRPAAARLAPVHTRRAPGGTAAV